jgi:uncharacterized protein YaaQ
MKLITAIVQDADAHRLVTTLTEKGFGTTKLATTGGFLRAGNTTLLIGVENQKLDEAIELVKKICKKRNQVTTASVPSPGTASAYVPYPVEVTVGGAIVFVQDVEQFIKI